MPGQHDEFCDCGCGRTYDDIIDEAIRADFNAQFEELKRIAREERGDETYTSKEVLDMINQGLKDRKRGDVVSADWLFEDDDE